MPCCSRASVGGGGGGPVPYRVYIYAAFILMCGLALAPQAPYVAVPAFFWFFITQAVLRRNVIFVYRPMYDSAGSFWPFLNTMCFSAMLMGEILLALQMVLKVAVIPAILVSLTVIPTIIFYQNCNNRYRRAYLDTALFQTSQIDFVNAESTEEEREEFRRFLVDAHKAAYVPVCLAGTEKHSFTAEPAVVVPSQVETPKEQQLSSPSFMHSINEATLNRVMNRTSVALTRVRRGKDSISALVNESASVEESENQDTFGKDESNKKFE